MYITVNDNKLLSGNYSIILSLLTFFNAWDARRIKLTFILPGTQWNGFVQHYL